MCVCVCVCVCVCENNEASPWIAERNRCCVQWPQNDENSEAEKFNNTKIQTHKGTPTHAG